VADGDVTGRAGVVLRPAGQLRVGTGESALGIWANFQ